MDAFLPHSGALADNLNRKIGIVGGAGYVGSSIANYLAEKHCQVKIFDIKPPTNCLNGEVEFRYCDIRDTLAVKENLKDLDLVIHTAIIQIPLINEKKKLGYKVNVVGTQNICKAVDENSNTKGMILTGTWHTIGEKELGGLIDEEFGFRPDKVENRARLYALSKMAQESIVRFYDEMSDKIYGIIRMGTVLGEGMPPKTAANIFIEQGLKGETITPYKHSMYRPMLYIDISDIYKAFENYVNKILNKEIEKSENSLAHIVNVYYPEPITILQLAENIRDTIIEYTNGRVKPTIEIVDKGIPLLFTKEDKKRIRVDIHKAKELLGLDQLKSPRESIRETIRLKLNNKVLTPILLSRTQKPNTGIRKGRQRKAYNLQAHLQED